MVSCPEFFTHLKVEGVEHYFGMPDPDLGGLMTYISERVLPDRHTLCASESHALAMASGVYLGTRKPALVYFSDRGLITALDPLLPLMGEKSAQIGVLILLGWGSQSDETLELLRGFKIPFEVMPSMKELAIEALRKGVSEAKSRSLPYALVVKPDSFEKYESKKPKANIYKLERPAVLRAIVECSSPNDLFICAGGGISRDLAEIRGVENQGRKEFFTVGTGGHCAAVAMGLAHAKPDRRVICIDGDGATLGTMGAMTIQGTHAPQNFLHILLNNGAYEGGYPSVGFNVDFGTVAQGCGYRKVERVKAAGELNGAIQEFLEGWGPSLLEIRTNRSVVKSDFKMIDSVENRKRFMESTLTSGDVGVSEGAG